MRSHTQTVVPTTLIIMSKKNTSRKVAQHSAQEAATELAQVGDLVQSQVEAGLDRDEVVSALFNSWSSRISSVCANILDKERTMLTKAVHLGPWREAQRKELALAILHSNADSAGNRRGNQKCHFIENMIPEDVFCKIRNWRQCSQLSRASMLAGVAKGIGIECPDQPTLYRLVSILAYCEDNFDMTQDQVFGLMDKIQTFIKSSGRLASLPYIINYPPSAAELPAELQKNAYPDGQLPPIVSIPELDVILGESRMRGRSSKVTMPWLEHVPEEYRAMFLQQINSGSSSSRGNASSAMLQSQPRPAPLPSAGLLRMRSSMDPSIIKKEAMLAAEVKREQDEFAKFEADEAAKLMRREIACHAGGGVVPTSPEDGASTPREKVAGSVSEMEQALVTGMKKGAAKAKAATAATAKATPAKKKAAAAKGAKLQRISKKGSSDARGKLMKKPAHGAAVALKKKPASAAGIDMSDVFTKLRKDRFRIKRNTFCSRAYDSAKRRMLVSGAKEPTVGNFARKQHATASELWDELG